MVTPHPSTIICISCKQPLRRESSNQIEILYQCECGATKRRQARTKTTTIRRGTLPPNSAA